ncbi:MAG: EcoRV family type II restriction endonuclease [Anaerolineales bacterium]|uniref:EcoRV family type II restriction endonuclease n=1 Tax=Candidatus Desulfolinea nitratireducens TaxID=2841698 RepID=A0A8J6TF74_9CHLR|nr:EcoRV family type II restriction endonuclease [Candidatus Desulfolinea nitratireducens]MBL6959529.1 EcoRV family type II restriction endonuclease [Anaerolineales bacterium]
MSKVKNDFYQELKTFVKTLENHISTEDGQWTIKGFIDTYKNIYSISSDTKVVSKILEIHLFPQIIAFAEAIGYAVVLPEYQNYYPDLSFINKRNETIKFAVDLKTTYRLEDYPGFCNGFTLGSHGEYFTNRQSTKNVQFPYGDYLGHFSLGIIYSRTSGTHSAETQTHRLSELQSITSVIGDFQFFVAEKWRIASDKSGSGNTANIGSIAKIEDVLAGKGVFSKLGEEWFDDYWMNYGKITKKDKDGKTRKITTLTDFVEYRGGDTSLVVPKARKLKPKKKKNG